MSVGTGRPSSICKYIDVSVQTDTYENVDMTELYATQYPPPCNICYSSTVIGGPIGNTKHIHFGKYYVCCKVCYKSTGPETLLVTYMLGEKPIVETVSTKPRNRADIIEYIFQKTQKSIDI